MELSQHDGIAEATGFRDGHLGPGPMVSAAIRMVSDRGAPSRPIRTELLDVV